MERCFAIKYSNEFHEYAYFFSKHVIIYYQLLFTITLGEVKA